MDCLYDSAAKNLPRTIPQKRWKPRRRGMIFSSASSSAAVVIRITNLTRLRSRLVTARIRIPPAAIAVMSSVPTKDLVEEKDKDEKKKMLPVEVESSKPVRIPEAPEKPLADDCCGSGCVRCVWDVYYEELEEYDNLLRSIDSTKQRSEIDRSN